MEPLRCGCRVHRRLVEALRGCLLALDLAVRNWDPVNAPCCLGRTAIGLSRRLLHEVACGLLLASLPCAARALDQKMEGRSRHVH